MMFCGSLKLKQQQQQQQPLALIHLLHFTSFCFHNTTYTCSIVIHVGGFRLNRLLSNQRCVAKYH